jgi:hypothetical protein
MCPTDGAASSEPRWDRLADPAFPSLKVVYCIDAIALGAIEKQLAALIRHLDPKMVRPHLCTLRPSSMDLGKLRCEVLGLPFTSFGSPTTGRCERQVTRRE